MAEPFHSLSVDQIIQLNRDAVTSFGGFSDGSGNTINRASLEYALEAALFPIFGEDTRPSVYDKIAAIAQSIITRHVFKDGNKRAGLAVITALCKANKLKFVPDKAAEDFMVRVAAESLSVEEVSAWLKKRAAKARAAAGPPHGAAAPPA